MEDFTLPCLITVGLFIPSPSGENYGKTMGKPWENHGKTMGKPWEMVIYIVLMAGWCFGT